jgi:hypothetical protein
MNVLLKRHVTTRYRTWETGEGARYPVMMSFCNFIFFLLLHNACCGIDRPLVTFLSPATLGLILAVDDAWCSISESRRQFRTLRSTTPSKPRTGWSLGSCPGVTASSGCKIDRLRRSAQPNEHWGDWRCRRVPEPVRCGGSRPLGFGAVPDKGAELERVGSGDRFETRKRDEEGELGRLHAA